VCGIAGLIGRADEAEARAMIERIVHRGPDGVRVETVGGAALAHARLSIIDLEGGWQPLHAAGSTVIGNGEIYNYLELAEEFGLGDKLSTGSDFEPLLHLYALEGEKAFERLRGMYAFCLIGNDGRTWLVRDPFGIKPLYYQQRDGALAFASEPRALLGGAAPQLSDGAAEELLALNYALSSPFDGIQRLRPGEVLEVKDVQVAASSLHGPVFGAPPGHREEASLLRKLDRRLEESVRIHQRSDVPYGLFLSGGIDSSVIATLMARLNQRPVVAYTCGFDAPGARDERGAAEAVAKALNLDWRETRFGEEDFWRIAPEVARALDDPTSDYATLATYKLAEAAKGTLTVVLTGEGGDELFGGYGRYRRALRPAWLGGRAAEPQLQAEELTDRGAGALQRWRSATAPPAGLSRLRQAQFSDLAGWLPNDLLLKLDRCLMAHGLEGRTPFLEPELARFALALPDHMKLRGGRGKWILREWLSKACPAADAFGRKKGFTVPVAHWIAPRAAVLGPRLEAHPGLRRFCKPGAVEAAFNDPARSHRWWPLLFFGLWWSIHVEGAGAKEALEALTGN
jgi:asparagine synthase (glutamine-hydrolysing)